MPGKGANSGGAEARSQSATLDQESLGAEVLAREFDKGKFREVETLRSHYADEIETDAKPDPDMVRRFQAGETNFTPALVYNDAQGKPRPVDEFSARMIASATAAGKDQRLNTFFLPNNPRQLAIGRQMQRLQQPNFGRLGPQGVHKAVGNLLTGYSDEISGGRTRASQRQIDRAAQNIRRNGGRAWLPVAVRAKGDRYEAVGDATNLAIARRANVRPWIYVVSE
jgi:hypothetical protein